MGIAERKNRQKQALRERILDASRRIVMREGFAALSMRKIADAIEYSPATLYLHFASRDEIAQALCEEGYAQLLATFEPHARIADPAERLKALGRAYIAFGVEHPQTYRLIFMEDPSYTGAALGGAARKAQASADEEAGAEVEDATTSSASSDSAAHTDDDPGAAALHIMLGALEELKAAGRLSASADVGVWAEAFWATLHGIVALNLTCPVFPTAPLDTVLNLTLDVWFGPSNAGVEPAAKAAPEPAAKPTPEPRAKPKAASA
ncbi:TetR/AcrR family transcriptional regulator [Paraburkholderia dilworthii]|uniref:TetR/AcrR family transcriptional regulator n=1 Tax=Paraburkholderia dilworthii TaxID=948106 RepID=A0ABW9DHH5_9BURK